MAIGSRLVYRKGIDLVVAAVPKICARKFGPDLAFSVDFLVGGDGPKRILFEEMIEQHHLQVMDDAHCSLVAASSFYLL